MGYAFFIGCKVPYYVPHYETSTRAVARNLGIELVDIEFNCCGYPMRHLDFQASILAAARNLALAEAQGLDLLTPCKCCFGTFKSAQDFLARSPQLKDKIAADLREEGLTFTGRSKVEHLLTVLFRQVGAAKVKEKVVKPFHDLKVAVLYGCHALRPSQVTGFDDPLKPSLFDQLVEATGAQSLDWAGKTQCCGEPLREKNDGLSQSLAKARLAEAAAAGAAYLCVGCTHSQLQLEAAYQALAAEKASGLVGGVILYPQLLGLALGLSPDQVALRVDPRPFVEAQKVPEKKDEPKKEKKPAPKAEEAEGSE